jgi:hypothetical protein
LWSFVVIVWLSPISRALAGRISVHPAGLRQQFVHFECSARTAFLRAYATVNADGAPIPIVLCRCRTKGHSLFATGVLSEVESEA